jgi:hypothetical protein
MRDLRVVNDELLKRMGVDPGQVDVLGDDEEVGERARKPKWIGKDVREEEKSDLCGSVDRVCLCAPLRLQKYVCARGKYQSTKCSLKAQIHTHKCTGGGPGA